MDSNGAVSMDYNELILMKDNEAMSTQWAATKPTQKDYNKAVQTDEDYEGWQVSRSPIPTGNLRPLVSNQEVRVSDSIVPTFFDLTAYMP